MHHPHTNMPGSPWLARVALLVLALAAGPAALRVTAVQAATDASAGSSPLLAPLAEMDSVRADLADFDARRAAWERELDATARALPKTVDDHGRTVGDDLSDYVVNSPAAQQRAADRERAKNAVEAGELAAARESLRALVAGLLGDRDRAVVIIRYWALRPAYVANRARFDRWRAAGALKPEDVDTLEPIYELLDHQIEAHEYAQAVLETYPVLDRLREKIWDERGRDILRGDSAAGSRRAAADRSHLLEWHSRASPCKARETASSSGPVPRVDVANSPPTAAYYPEESQRIGEEGVVTLWVEVSVSGCPQRAFALVPTGYDRLDQAALKWLFDARFLPAEKEGKAVAGAVALRVRFTSAER